MHRSRKMLCICWHSPLAGFAWLLMQPVRGLDHRCPVLQCWVLPGDLNTFQTAKCMHTPELVLFSHKSTLGKIKNHKHFLSLEVAEALTETRPSLQDSIHNLPWMVSNGPTSLRPKATWFVLPISLTPRLLLPFRSLQGCL